MISKNQNVSRIFYFKVINFLVSSVFTLSSDARNSIVSKVFLQTN